MLGRVEAARDRPYAVDSPDFPRLIAVEPTKILAKRSAERSGGIPLLSKLTKVRRAYQIGWVSAVNSAISHHTSVDFYSLGTSILSSDGLHPTGSGYQKMAELLSRRLPIISERNRPKDSDGDGLYDWEEPNLGTNKFVTDTDGDGLSDGDEVYVYHTNPLIVDSDADGLSDSYEANVLGSNPTSALPGSPTIRKLEAIAP